MATRFLVTGIAKTMLTHDPIRLGAHDGDRTRPTTARQAVSPTREKHGQLEDRGGNDPLAAGLKIQCRHLPDYTLPVQNWSSQKVSNLHLSIINRMHRPPCSTRMVGRCGFDPLPLRTSFTDSLTEPPSFPTRYLVPLAGTDPASTAYQAVILPLDYRGGGWRCIRNRRP